MKEICFTVLVAQHLRGVKLLFPRRLLTFRQHHSHANKDLYKIFIYEDSKKAKDKEEEKKVCPAHLPPHHVQPDTARTSALTCETR